VRSASLSRVCLLGLVVSACLYGSTNVNRLVATDLNGDRKVDLATAGASRHEGTGFIQEITVRLGALDTSTIVVRTTSVAHRLRAFDLDGDADRDLVLEAFDREPLAVLLNDGGGHFHLGNLEDFRVRLGQRDSRSIEAAIVACDSTDIGEDACNPAADPEVSGFQPEMASARLPAERDGLWPILGHSSSSGRGPPRL
jgi:hypothetical protein